LGAATEATNSTKAGSISNTSAQRSHSGANQSGAVGAAL
jgi:hypothetical protein